MVNLVRSISFRKKPKEPKVSVDENTNQDSPFTQAAPGDPFKLAAKEDEGKSRCPVLQGDVERILTATIELPFAAIVKTISSEVVKPISKLLSDVWNMENGEFMGPLAPVFVHPRDVLGTINVKDITESVSETLMALIHKFAQEFLAPFLKVLRKVLKTTLGDRYPSVISWVENVVTSLIPALLRALFAGQENTKFEKWIMALTQDLLDAFKEPEEKVQATAKTTGSPFEMKNNLKTQTSSVFQQPPDESVEGSLKDALDDFKVHVDKALK